MTVRMAFQSTYVGSQEGIDVMDENEEMILKTNDRSERWLAFHLNVLVCRHLF